MNKQESNINHLGRIFKRYKYQEQLNNKNNVLIDNEPLCIEMASVSGIFSPLFQERILNHFFLNFYRFFNQKKSTVAEASAISSFGN